MSEKEVRHKMDEELIRLLSSYSSRVEQPIMCQQGVSRSEYNRLILDLNKQIMNGGISNFGERHLQCLEQIISVYGENDRPLADLIRSYIASGRKGGGEFYYKEYVEGVDGARVAQLVERSLGKAKVEGANPSSGFEGE